jgi:hypothetical protein
MAKALKFVVEAKNFAVIFDVRFIDEIEVINT